MTTLEQYLNDQKIEPIRLSIEAGVRYLTVWNAVKEKPIFFEHAQKIRFEPSFSLIPECYLHLEEEEFPDLQARGD